MSRRSRDAYAAVGEATRASIERVIATAEGREFTRITRTFLAFLHFTSTRSRMSDGVYLGQLADVAKIAGDVDDKHLADALKALDERGALVYRPSTAHGKPSWVGLPGSLAVQSPILASVRGATNEPVGGH